MPQSKIFRRTLMTWSLLAGVGLLLSAPALGAGHLQVSIQDLAFQPSSTQVEAGETVTWTNADGGIPHTVTALDGSFDSGNLGEGQTLTHTFDSAGEFQYRCEIHPAMTGVVNVAGAAPEPTEPPAQQPPPAPEAADPPAQERPPVQQQAPVQQQPPAQAPPYGAGTTESELTEDTLAAASDESGGGLGAGAISALILAGLAVIVGGGVLLYRAGQSQA
jgi:plastocyanin